MASTISISDLRKEFGDTLEAFGARLGIRSKGHVSQIEGGSAACSFDVALKLEELSGGRIDAAALNEDVARARLRSGASLNMAPADSAADTIAPGCKRAPLTTPPVTVPEDGLALSRRVA